MRFNPLLVLFVGLGAALTYKRDPRRSDAVSDSTLSAPPGAPADFVTSFEFLDHEVAEDVANLQPVTQETSAKRRALRALKRQDPGDFYECTNTPPQPQSSDCSAVISTISSTQQPLILSQYACVLYSSGTCRAFYCSLCGTLETSTDFLTDQLNLLQALCLPSGRGGNVVHEGSGGWQAGLGHVNGSLPFYDICEE